MFFVRSIITAIILLSVIFDPNSLYANTNSNLVRLGDFFSDNCEGSLSQKRTIDDYARRIVEEAKKRLDDLANPISSANISLVFRHVELKKDKLQSLIDFRDSLLWDLHIKYGIQREVLGLELGFLERSASFNPTIALKDLEKLTVSGRGALWSGVESTLAMILETVVQVNATFGFLDTVEVRYSRLDLISVPIPGQSLNLNEILHDSELILRPYQIPSKMVLSRPQGSRVEIGFSIHMLDSLQNPIHGRTGFQYVPPGALIVYRPLVSNFFGVNVDQVNVSEQSAPAKLVLEIDWTKENIDRIISFLRKNPSVSEPTITN